MSNSCPHCGTNVSDILLRYYLDIVTKDGSSLLQCPACSQMFEVSPMTTFVISRPGQPDSDESVS